MQLSHAFRLSTYSTLILACLCLGYSEGDLLPEMPIITGFVVVMVAFAYRSEGRWSLSLQSANTVGAILAFGLIGWIAFQFLRPSVGLIEALPFPANLLPYLGPVLMILVPAKLFRPKHIGDYWALQGIGLLAVTLGCAMANDLFFGVLLVGYICCFAWALAMFHLYRETGAADQRAPTAGGDEPPRRFYLLHSASRWSVVVMAVGAFLFLITPRPAERKWELSLFSRGNKMDTGLSDSVDLNRVGHLEQNNEIAFRVHADDAEGNPKLDLNADQRWRATAFSRYENGRWAHERERNTGLNVVPALPPQHFGRKMDDGHAHSGHRRDLDPAEFRAIRNERLPHFGATDYYLMFALQNNTVNANILAEPVMWSPAYPPPILVEGVRTGGVQQSQDGEFYWLSLHSAGHPGYSQVVWPPPEPEFGPPLNVVVPGFHECLIRIGSPEMEQRLQRWTRNVLERLVNGGRLPAEALIEDPDTHCPPAKYHEAIARALGSYLSNSGEFVYSFDLARKNKSLDPAEDFLYNTKEGHCERFASGLVLMLRSLRIPAQLVIGFRGCEAQGDGWYAVRSSQAHAWAEVLVSRSPPANELPLASNPKTAPNDAKPDTVVMQWLSIDPTPAGEPVSANGDGLASWLESTRMWADATFKNFVLSYDSHIRQRAAESIAQGVSDVSLGVRSGNMAWTIVPAGISMCLMSWFALVRLGRRRRNGQANESVSRTADLEMPLHGRLIALLARHGFAPCNGETTLEFTTAVAAQLRTFPTTRAAADLPRQVGEAYYRVRFGEQALEEREQQTLVAGMQRLETALAEHRAARNAGESA